MPQCKKNCASEGKVCNEATAKCVKADGRIGKQIAAGKTIERRPSGGCLKTKCSGGMLCNPHTHRCVHPHTATGKKVASRRYKTGPKAGEYKHRYNAHKNFDWESSNATSLIFPAAPAARCPKGSRKDRKTGQCKNSSGTVVSHRAAAPQPFKHTVIGPSEYYNEHVHPHIHNHVYKTGGVSHSAISKAMSTSFPTISPAKKTAPARKHGVPQHVIRAAMSTPLPVRQKAAPRKSHAAANDGMDYYHDIFPSTPSMASTHKTRGGGKKVHFAEPLTTTELINAIMNSPGVTTRSRGAGGSIPRTKPLSEKQLSKRKAPENHAKNWIGKGQRRGLDGSMWEVKPYKRQGKTYHKWMPVK